MLLHSALKCSEMYYLCPVQQTCFSYRLVSVVRRQGVEVQGNTMQGVNPVLSRLHNSTFRF